MHYSTPRREMLFLHDHRILHGREPCTNMSKLILARPQQLLILAALTFLIRVTHMDCDLHCMVTTWWTPESAWSFYAKRSCYSDPQSTHGRGQVTLRQASPHYSSRCHLCGHRLLTWSMVFTCPFVVGNIIWILVFTPDSPVTVHNG